MKNDQITQNIYLKCTGDCNGYYQYKFDNNDILALTGHWRNEESKNGIWDGLLPTKPEIGEIYELTLRGPLKIDISENFWVIYFDPYSTYEGIESDEAIKNLVICLCQQIEIIEIQERNIRISVKVKQIKNI